MKRRSPGETRKLVGLLLGEGRSQAETARELGISKSSVAYHARNLDRAPDPRFSKRYDWDEVQRAYDSGSSFRECKAKFGFTSSSWQKAVRRGAITPRPAKTPLADFLVAGVKRGRHHLKRRLIAAGLKENRCEICGTTEWLGRPLTMELHHVNGDGRDNRLENLQLLCANCHSQTDNWGGRARRRPERGRRAKEPA